MELVRDALDLNYLEKYQSPGGPNEFSTLLEEVREIAKTGDRQHRPDLP